MSLWQMLAEQSARFDAEGFDRFTEVTAHAALARDRFESSAFSHNGERGPLASGNPYAKSGVIQSGRNRALWESPTAHPATWGCASIDDE